jgi:methionyl-tRNA formyltransferase
MAPSLRVLLLAEESAGAQTLRLLAGSRHHVVAVLTSDPEPNPGGATVAGMASRLGYRLWPSRQVNEPGFDEIIRREEVDLLLNVQGGRTLPRSAVAAPRIGCFNLHLGPLPRYAGLNPPSWAIYHGQHTHGVTVHWMDQQINTGPVAYESIVDIDEDETGLTLSAKCVRAGLPLLSDLLEDASRDAIPRRAQATQIRRHYGRDVPHQGQLWWTESAIHIVNFIRACDYFPFPSPWGYPRAWISGREVLVLKAALTSETGEAPAGTVGRCMGEDVLVRARDAWVQVQRVQIGSSVFSPAEVLQTGERFALPRESELSGAAQ